MQPGRGIQTLDNGGGGAGRFGRLHLAGPRPSLERLVKTQTTATADDTLSAVMAPVGAYIARLAK